MLSGSRTGRRSRAKAASISRPRCYANASATSTRGRHAINSSIISAQQVSVLIPDRGHGEVGIYSMQRPAHRCGSNRHAQSSVVLTQAPGLGPVEAEWFITFPVETAMRAGCPALPTFVPCPGLIVVGLHLLPGRGWICISSDVLGWSVCQRREAIPCRSRNTDDGPISTGLGEIFSVRGARQGQVVDGLGGACSRGHCLPVAPVPGVVEVNSIRRRDEDA